MLVKDSERWVHLTKVVPGDVFLRRCYMTLAQIVKVPSRGVLVEHGHERRHWGREGARVRVGLLHARAVEGVAPATLVGAALAPVASGVWSDTRSDRGGRDKMYTGQAELYLLRRRGVGVEWVVVVIVVGKGPFPGKMGTIGVCSQKVWDGKILLASAPNERLKDAQREIIGAYN
jgi:hypothetical protein